MDTLPSTKFFKYFGSQILYNLRNDDDIEACLSAANKIMRALKEVWQNPHLDTYSKYLLFRAIPINLLLWGCKNWLLKQDLLRRLEVFLHQNICHILHIFIYDFKVKLIQNKKMENVLQHPNNPEHDCGLTTQLPRQGCPWPSRCSCLTHVDSMLPTQTQTRTPLPSQ